MAKTVKPHQFNRLLHNGHTACGESKQSPLRRNNDNIKKKTAGFPAVQVKGGSAQGDILILSKINIFVRRTIFNKELISSAFSRPN
jgi:hypothetical protein